MRRMIFAIPALLCACGGSGGSSVTDQGHTLNPKSGLVAQASGGSEILISDVGGLCTTLTNVDPCNPSSLGTQISTITSLTIVVTGVEPGTYTVGGFTGDTDAGFDPTHVAQVQFLSTEGGILIDSASSGTVTLTKLSAGGPAEGTYDVTMGKGDHLTGNFNAEDCPALVNVNSAGPVCSGDDGSSGSSCTNTCTCKGKTVKAACSENADSSFDCTCTDASGATSTCHATDVDSFVACERDFGCCPLSF